MTKSEIFKQAHKIAAYHTNGDNAYYQRNAMGYKADYAKNFAQALRKLYFKIRLAKYEAAKPKQAAPTVEEVYRFSRNGE